MSATYRHFIGPRPSSNPSSNSCKKKTCGSDVYSLARRLLAEGTIISVAAPTYVRIRTAKTGV